jgi:hypothetical protein
MGARAVVRRKILTPTGTLETPTIQHVAQRYATEISQLLIIITKEKRKLLICARECSYLKWIF